MVENNRAIVYILQGELEKVEESLERVLAVDPADEDALANLEIVRSRRGQIPVATGPSAKSESTGQKGETVELELEGLEWKR